MALFMLAARWPDDMRGTSFHHETWHYINYAYRPGGGSGPSVISTPGDVYIEDAFKSNLATASDTTASDSDRAIALCWVLHLMGDAHQPLHTTALVNLKYPQGDRGGNSFLVKKAAGQSTVKLHGLWDDAVITNDKIAPVNSRANGLLTRSDLQKSQFQELSNPSFHSWASQEGLSRAIQYSYKFKGKAIKDKGAVLPVGYVTKAKSVAERQIALASFRLTDALQAVPH
jgi:hypothetical protein